MNSPSIKQPPRRVVSLVPSLTESFFDLGLGDRLVGVTDFCTQPSDGVAKLQKVGGPADARLDAILDLNPDLVMAGVEENPPGLIDQLKQAKIEVWAVFPKTIQDVLDLLNDIAWVFKSDAALRTVKTLETVMDAALIDHAGVRPWRYFCPIWTDVDPRTGRWWMTFNQDTYSSNLLGMLGGVNCCAERRRREPLTADLNLGEPSAPLGADDRYPRMTTAEVSALSPQVIILPDEPFAFESGHIDLVHEAFASTPAVQNKAIYCVDGSLITWYGTRMAKALTQLAGVLK
jgi:ABC-type hemin transport system substrate-binding protein